MRLNSCWVDAHPFDVASTHYSVHPVSPEPTGIPSEGKPTTSTQEPIYYGVYSYLSSKSSCAQHIFSIFLLNAACDIPRVSGHTVLDDKAASGNYNLQLQNSILAELAGAVALTGLCTVKEAYFGIIPALSFKNKLPGVECVVEYATPPFVFIYLFILNVGFAIYLGGYEARQVFMKRLAVGTRQLRTTYGSFPHARLLGLRMTLQSELPRCLWSIRGP